MQVLIACDKFKGSLDAISVCDCLKEGMLSQNPELIIETLPVADGGDGSLNVLDNNSIGFYKVYVNTLDPLGRPLEGYYLSNGKTAIVELAIVSGIARLAPEELDVMQTSTLGTGILIKDAIDAYHKEIVICLGGSCTTDAGLGMLQALGYSYSDISGNNVNPIGRNLRDIVKITAPNKFLNIQFKVLVDVDNELFGEQGAAHVYGPQKGASQAEVLQLDAGLRHIAKLFENQFNKDVSSIKGGGAAGGIAAGCFALLDAKLVSGFEYISKAIGFEDKLIESDIVITGEGRVDSQSFQGKVIGQIIDKANQLKKKVIIVAGDSTIEKDLQEIKAIHLISEYEPDLVQAISKASIYLKRIGSRIALELD